MDAVHIGIQGIAAVAAIFLAGMILYIVVSFLQLSRFSERRSPWLTLQHASREALWVCITQPILPLYFMLGRHMGGNRDEGTPIVLIHGYMQNRVAFLRIAKALRARGCGPIHAFNYAWWKPIGDLASALERFIEDVRRQTQAAQVDLVCHSMGGVIAVEYLTSRKSKAVRRMVTLASPHAGIMWRGPVLGAGGRELRAHGPFQNERKRLQRPLPIQVLSIASTHDNLVHPVETSRLAHRGGYDVVVPHLGHLAILYDPEVVAIVATYIVEGNLPQANIPAPEYAI